MATRPRLEFALERLQPSDWHRFERLSSAFLANEFDSLRTVASSSGDDGRDAELFSPLSEPRVAVQYSIAADWNAKITATVTRCLLYTSDAAEYNRPGLLHEPRRRSQS